MTPPARCPHCDAELPAELREVARFCPICGKMLEAEPEAAAEPTAPQTAQPEPATAPPAWRVAPVTGPQMMAPAFMAGIAGGMLVGVPGTSNLFCLWMVGCGALAVFFFHKQFGRAALPNEAARLGVLSGFFGFVVASLVAFFSYALIRRSPFGLVDQLKEHLKRSAESNIVKPEDAARALELIDKPGGAAVMLLSFATIYFLSFVALSMLGGLIAGALSRRR